MVTAIHFHLNQSIQNIEHVFSLYSGLIAIPISTLLAIGCVVIIIVMIEIPRKNLKLEKKLGDGVYGIVYKGNAHETLYHEKKIKVVVKMIKDLSNVEVSLILKLKLFMELFTGLP